MSVLNIGANDVSEEQRALRDKISSKETHIAAQQAQLMRQASEMEELQTALNDALHKLHYETNRALQLEATITQQEEDLRKEKISSQNVKATLISAQTTIKQKESEVRELESTLQSVAQVSNQHNDRSLVLGREKGVLEARIRELELELQRHARPPVTPRAPVLTTRRRSSSLSGLKVSNLEQELAEVRRSLTNKQGELDNMSRRATQLQEQFLKSENERLAVGKQYDRELQALREALEEKVAELKSYEQHGMDGSREDELLRRIDEDEAKIVALERLLAEQDDRGLKEKVKRLEKKLKEDGHRLSELEEREARLLEEQRDTARELEHVNDQLQAKIQLLREKERQLEDALNDRSAFEGFPPQTESLLVTINRLRGERDDLRRDLQFLQVESTFTIQALEASVAELSKRTPHIAPQMELTHVQELRRLTLMNSALLVVFSREHSLNTNNEASLIELRHQYDNMLWQLDCKTKLAEEISSANRDLQSQLNSAKQYLEEASARHEAALTQSRSQDHHWSEEVARLRAAQKEYTNTIQHLQSQAEALSRDLQGVESERDSFRLQVTNLSSDLQKIQQQLTDSESRYTQLQLHQLSGMPTSDATRPLQRQVEELESRVMRRTEQIGIHQHDIKRLETNLRLQEDRLAELTMELETVGAQKAAMVEDCADAREARDRAVSQLEQTEEELEAIESKLYSQEQTITTLVEVVFKTMYAARGATRLHRAAAAETHQHKHRLSGAYDQLSQQARVLEDLVQHQNAAQDDFHQVVLALAVHRQCLSAATNRLSSVNDERNALSSQLSVVAHSLAAEQQRVAMLNNELKLVRDQVADSEASHEAQLSTKDDQLQQLQDDLLAKEKDFAMATRRVSELEAEMRDLIRKQDDAHIQHQNQAMDERAQEVEGLMRRIQEQSQKTEDLEAQYEAVRELHEKATAELAQVKEDQQGSEDARLAEIEELKATIASTQREQESERTRLEQDLKFALERVQEITEARERVERLRQELEDKIAQMETDISATNTSWEVIKAQLEEELQGSQAVIKEHESKFSQLQAEKENLAQRLDIEIDRREEDSRLHTRELDGVAEQRKQMESSLMELQEKAARLMEELAQAQALIEELQLDKQSWQEKVAALNAENERLASLQNFLQNQIRESESTLTSLREDLAKTREELTQRDSSKKAAEVSLELQSAQYKREITELRDELAMLRSRPKLEAVIAELEERNTEMEETLRTKCKEIEENDDRALEMLKTNKKLTSKVETLTRKVQNLQAKLAAAKASLPQPVEKAAEPTPMEISVPVQEPPAPMLQHPPTLTNTQHPSLANPLATSQSNRSDSQPQAPQTHRSETVLELPLDRSVSMPEPVAGKKRPAPDDFDTCESVPPQAFTAESIPRDILQERKTPRLRRALSNPHASFTPVRGRRPGNSVASPNKRGPTDRPIPHLITDVTNSPRQSNQAARPSKRSWLGKIRNASSQPGEKTSSLQNFKPVE
ncbi:hypothetical protein AX16_000442 [Volvariella volvacea WC 439]|nr:hypothetical protein AX16_000442 [Volvariella volvacea WC 439]